MGGTEDKRVDNDIQPTIKKFALFEKERKDQNTSVSGIVIEKIEPSSAVLPQAQKPLPGINPLHVKGSVADLREETRKPVAVAQPSAPPVGASITQTPGISSVHNGSTDMRLMHFDNKIRTKHSASRAGRSSDMTKFEDDGECQIKMAVIKEHLKNERDSAGNTFITGTDDAT